MYGFQGKWLRVNLTNRTIEEQVFEEEELKKYLGSSGMGIKILIDETGPETDPLGPDNVIIFAAGLLNNTKALCGGRYQIVSKSPLTGAFGESNSGGTWGPMLRKAGFDGVIITGKADKPVYITIIDGKAEIHDADGLWGLDSFETSDKLKEIHGKRTVTACIGQAGENLVRFAAVMNDGEEGRCAGRTGMGAVMGSKNLKAIAVQGTEKMLLKNEPALNDDVKEVAKEANQTIIAALRKYGTAGGFGSYIDVGEIPIKNWQLGMMDNLENLTASAVEKAMEVKHYTCAQCILGCGRSVQVTEGKYASIKTGGLEYETLGTLGAQVMVTDVQAVQMGNELCNRYGLDTISCGNTIAWAMEAYDYGLITKDDTNGLELNWGDPDVMIEMVKRISLRQDVGNLLAEGIKIAAETLGKGSSGFAVHVRGLDPVAHDPRGHVSSGISYATNPRGACHQAGTHSYETAPNIYASVRAKFNKTITPGKSENMGYWVAEMQNYMQVIETIGACKMGGLAVGYDAVAKYSEWIELTTGWKFSDLELAEIGERLFNLKWLYNYRMGVTREDMTLPPRLTTRKRGQGGNAEVLPNVNLMLSEYFYQRGWSELGVPLPETLKRLGLQKYATKDIVTGPALNIG